MSIPPPFIVGDTVRLKSGGPLMTVEKQRLLQSNDPGLSYYVVSVTWFCADPHNGPCQAQLRADLLEKAKP